LVERVMGYEVSLTIWTKTDGGVSM
jgi:hypothetical protein